MSASRWDPFRDLLALQERMNRLFDESLHRSRAIGQQGFEGSAFTPAVDIYETRDHVVVTAELAGLTRDDINIQIENDSLVLSGERKLTMEVKPENFHRLERSYGRFHRVFTLPPGIDLSRIAAHFRDGLLVITIPKTAASQPHRIAINQ